MSDLDADLYGDLYGNDETDFAEQDEKTGLTPEEQPTEGSPAQTQTQASKFSEGTTSKAQESSTDAKSQQQQTVAALQQPSSPIAPPVTQQIPTYEQPQPSDYRETPVPRAEGNFQNIPVNERSVRPSEMKDEGKMFIGGLNWDTTDESLRDYFSQFGKVDACTIMRDAGGRSRCFAFLTFEDPASVNAVMVREHFLDGKTIDPKRAIPRQEHQRATKLFIGGLAGTVTSESMREFFSQFGKVIDSTVMLDRETGRSKGFGFVSFEDTNVQPFLGFGNLEIDGKLIDVKLAQPRYQRDNYNEDGSGGDFPQGGSGGAMAGPTGGAGGNAVRFAGNQGGNFNAMGGMPGAGGVGLPGAQGVNAGAPVDSHALAALYTRMLQQMSGGMNPAMMMGMNPMMGMPGGQFAPGTMRGGMGMMGNPAMGIGGMGMMGMGRGMGMGGVGMNPNIPRGPRGAPGGPQGPAAGPMGAAGVGPQRTGQRGQHNFHPYSR